MTLSRKEFFRQGLFSLGETLLKVSGAVRETQQQNCIPANEFTAEREPVADGSKVARVDNRHCLAGYCGCFSCVDRCESAAISVVMGEGVRIDAALCSGCGTCEYVCPVTPKALQMVCREQS